MCRKHMVGDILLKFINQEVSSCIKLTLSTLQPLTRITEALEWYTTSHMTGGIQIGHRLVGFMPF